VSVKLGVVTPMANEEPTAVEFVDAVLDRCSRDHVGPVTFFAVVDRASHDGTRRLLEEHARTRPELRVVWAPETRGVADAYVRGYREALAAGCDWVLEIDGGFSHDPAEIGRFLGAAAAGSECVFGTRFDAGGANDADLRRRAISRGGTVLTNLLLGTGLSDATSGFELFTRGALEQVLARGIHSRGPFFQTEIKAYCKRFRSVEVPIHYAGGSHRVQPAALGESFVNLGRLFALRLRGAL
jgi:dolichol-phosphate mannosyltransferase